MPQGGEQSFQQEQPFLDAQFDIIDWHPYFQSCVRYFLEHAQYSGPVQALAAFINIQLPFQRAQNHVLLSRAFPAPAAAAAVANPGIPPAAQPPPPPHSQPHQAPHNNNTPYAYHHHNQHHDAAPLVLPYIRRLVATGLDLPAVLHGLFGDDWEPGVGPLREQERRNYLLAARSGSWLEVKRAYDMGAAETVPFLRPLRGVAECEIEAAEAAWSEWGLAMQDWMLGPRSVATSSSREVRIKHEGGN